MAIKKFKYRKPDGKESDRTVYILKSPSNMYFGIDLTEFDIHEKNYYISELNKLEQKFLNAITELGLDSCYRNFKESRIVKDV